MIYVDPLMPALRSAKWRFGKSCHLFGDTLEELNAFAVRVGLRVEWLQTRRGDTIPGRYHYDLTTKRREVAVRLGARQISHRECFKLRHGVTVEEMAHRGPDFMRVEPVGPTDEQIRSQRLASRERMQAEAVPIPPKPTKTSGAVTGAREQASGHAIEPMKPGELL